MNNPVDNATGSFAYVSMRPFRAADDEAPDTAEEA